MSSKKQVTNKEQKLLKRIRAEYSKEECINFWYARREGSRKKFPSGFLQNPKYRQYIVQEFVREFQENKCVEVKQKTVLLEEKIFESEGKKYKEIHSINELQEVLKVYPQLKDFQENKLGGLMQSFYGCSPYAAFIEAGFTNPKSELYDGELAETPWTKLSRLPNNYWQGKENRIKAIKWLVDKIKKLPGTQDFTDNNLDRLLDYFNNSPFKTLKEAGYEINEWELLHLPRNLWHKKENRIRAMKYLVSKLEKPVSKIESEDFVKHHLSELYTQSHGRIPKLLKEAGI